VVGVLGRDSYLKGGGLMGRELLGDFVQGKEDAEKIE